MKLRAGSLFTGIGGLDLAVNYALDCDTAWMCESDPQCRRVLEHRFPGIPIVRDVRELDETAPPIDVLHGGYPCQPFSIAGSRAGENDPRHLWPEFARLVRLLRPRLVVGENVADHLSLGFDRVLADLAEMGMDVRWGTVRASDVGAPHGRERLFFVAADAERVRVDTEGRDGRGGDRSARASVSSGQEVALAADSLEDGADPSPDTGSVARPSTGERARGSGAGGVEASRGDSREAVGRASGRARSREREAPPDVEWGVYGEAITRWERLTGVTPPRPTDDRRRLEPRFVEWMMGFPLGWTEGTRRTHRLRMLGNAVVPAQGTLAIQLLQQREES